MPQLFFIWNNKDCRSMGVTLRNPVPIVRPEERVQHVEIPGRSGDLTQTEGEEIYNSYIQTAEITVKGGFRVRDVYRWLRGSGFVIFHGEPDRRQQARIIGAVTLNKVSRNLDKWAGEVQFYCQPLKELLQEEAVTITSSGSTVRNNGDVTSKPKITLTASGTSATVAAGGKILTITGLTSGNDYIIDSDIQEVTNAAATEILTQNTTGKWPVLNQGNNIVIGTGWSKMVIEKRERFV